MEDRPSVGTLGAKALWCPFASIVDIEMPTHGYYSDHYPKGAVVHYSAGLQGKGNIAYGAKMGFAYFVIDRAGTIYQSVPLNRWGSHAGKSSWEGMEGGVSRHLVGIEIDSYGILSTSKGLFSAWSGQTVHEKEARKIDKDEDNIKAGVYHAYTVEQETALTRLLLWLKLNNPDHFDLDLVLGHDEVSPGRKTDPGGALFTTMPMYRQYLHKLWKERGLGV